MALTQVGNAQAEALLRDYTVKTEKLREEMRVKAKVEIDTLLRECRAALVDLERQGNAQLALELKAYLQKVESAQDAFGAIDEAVGTMPSIATGIHKHVVALEDDVLKVNKDYAPKLDRLAAPVLKALKQQLQVQRRANPVGAQNVRKLYLDLLAVPNPKFDDQIPPLPTDPEEAEVVFKRFREELKIATDADLRRGKWNLFANLYGLRKEAIQENDIKLIGRIDEVYTAFTTTESLPEAIERGEAERRNPDRLKGIPHVADPTGWWHVNRDKFPERLNTILEPYCAWGKDRVARHNKISADCNKRWAPFNSRELKGLLSSNTSFEDLRRNITKQFKLSGETPEWLSESYHVPLPNSTPQVMRILQAFDDAAAKRLEAVNQADAAERDVLIAKLEKLTDADAIEESGRMDVLKVLKGDFGTGIRGVLVLDVDERLSKEAYVPTASYLESALKRIEELTQKHNAALTECRSKLKGARTALVNQSDFEGVLLLEMHLKRRENPIPPIWIRVSTDQSLGLGRRNYSRSSPTRLVSRKADQFLVMRYGDNYDWVPRHQVLLSWNEIEETEEDVADDEIRRPTTPPKSLPPSKKLDDTARLSIGEKVLVQTAIGMEVLQVADLSPFGVVVERGPFGSKPKLEVFPRAAVRKML